MNIRNNEELQRDLHRAREVLGIKHIRHGADPEVIRQSLKFVIEANHLLLEQFKVQYGPLTRDYIKKKLNEGI